MTRLDLHDERRCQTVPQTGHDMPKTANVVWLSPCYLRVGTTALLRQHAELADRTASSFTCVWLFTEVDDLKAAMHLHNAQARLNTVRLHPPRQRLTGCVP